MENNFEPLTRHAPHSTHDLSDRIIHNQANLNGVSPPFKDTKKIGCILLEIQTSQNRAHATRGRVGRAAMLTFFHNRAPPAVFLSAWGGAGSDHHPCYLENQ